MGFKFGQSLATRQEVENLLPAIIERHNSCNVGRVRNGYEPLLWDYTIVSTDKRWTLDMPEQELLAATAKYRN